MVARLALPTIALPLFDVGRSQSSHRARANFHPAPANFDGPPADFGSPAANFHPAAANFDGPPLTFVRDAPTSARLARCPHGRRFLQGASPVTMCDAYLEPHPPRR